MDSFEHITGDWIREKLREHSLRNGDLAAGLNVSDSQVSLWLSGGRTPAKPTLAAIHFFFQNLELKKHIGKGDLLKLPDMQYLAVRIPISGNRYLILWNSHGRKLLVNKSDLDEIEYIDLSRYKYLLLNPDIEHFNFLFEFVTGPELRLMEKSKGDLARNVKVIYGWEKNVKE
ncbi:MAG TPA: helix-turn-helix transcriptional regulator [Ohtaekwangia sp.]|nr:helix-turn-helix transcriptional regulator [Ohtaekwangia sp.]